MKKGLLLILGSAILLSAPFLAFSQAAAPRVVDILQNSFNAISGDEKDYSLEVTCNYATTVTLTAVCPQGVACSLSKTTFPLTAGGKDSAFLTVDTHQAGSFELRVNSSGCSDPSTNYDLAWINVSEPIDENGCAPGIFYDPASGFSSSPVAALGDSITVPSGSVFYAFVDYKSQDSGVNYPSAGWNPDILAPNSAGQYSCEFEDYGGEFGTVGRYRCCTEGSSVCSNPIPSGAGSLTFSTFAKYQVPGGSVCERTDTLGTVTVDGKMEVDVEPETSAVAKGTTAVFDVTTTLEGRSGTVNLAITCPSGLSCSLDQYSRSFSLDPSDDVWFGNKLRVDTSAATAGNTYNITVGSTGYPLDGAKKDDTVSLHVSSSASNSIILIKSGQGTVTSNPSGINCGFSCNSQTSDFESDINVTLTANPSSGRIFTGWGGDCAAYGTGSCTLYTNVSHTVYAYFVTIAGYSEF